MPPAAWYSNGTGSGDKDPRTTCEANMHAAPNAVSGGDQRMRSVDLAPFRDADLRIFAGRDRGQSARTAVQLDQLDFDARFDRVVIRVPEDTWDVSSGFWLGMFGPSVRRLRRDGFMARYEFRGGFRREDVEAGIEEALSEEDPFAPG
jgi:hypothetical protein